jgi:CRISPR/Cas system CSM-associated protein Csm5 (group 7 of RAMP superfamily)
MKNTTHFFLLTVHSPLHLGCGEVYEPTGFVVDENLNQYLPEGDGRVADGSLSVYP